jgi:hypothetical protein
MIITQCWPKKSNVYSVELVGDCDEKDKKKYIQEKDVGGIILVF